MRSSTRIQLSTLLLLVACGSPKYPGMPLARQFSALVERWGCDYPTVRADHDRLMATVPAGMFYRVQLGWTACETLAHLGLPSEADETRTADLRTATWWYRIGDILLHLEHSEDEWRVMSITGQ